MYSMLECQQFAEKQYTLGKETIVGQSTPGRLSRHRHTERLYFHNEK